VALRVVDHECAIAIEPGCEAQRADSFIATCRRTQLHAAIVSDLHQVGWSSILNGEDTRCFLERKARRASLGPLKHELGVSATQELLDIGGIGAAAEAEQSLSPDAPT